MKSPLAIGPVLVAGLTCLSVALPPPAFALHADGFLRNHGQIGDPVRFYGAAPGAAVYLTPEAIVVDLKSGGRGCAVWIRFEGASPSAVLEGRNPLPGKTNFYRGADPEQWITGLSAFAEVVYHDLWPGIDLACRHEGGQLEYEFTVRPGANAALATFGYDGVDSVIRESANTSRLETPLGALWDVRTSDTSGSILLASPPPGGVLQTSENPDLLEWCTYLGGSEIDSGNAVALDDASRPVVAGQTRSEDFPATIGAYQESIANPGVLQYDAFVAKLDASADSLLWCTYLGGQGSDVGWAVALDPLGAPIVSGDTYSWDFPTTPGCFDSTKAGTTSNPDVFVTKLDPDGGALLWSTFLGAGKDDNLFDLEIDAPGNVFLVGLTESSGFPTTPDVFDDNKSFPLSSAGFVTKMNSTGTALVWSTVIEGSANDAVHGLALDALGNVSICGPTASSNFPVLAGSYDDNHNGGTDAFVGTLSADGSTLLAGTFLGTPGTDEALSVDHTWDGQVVVGGHTDDGTFPTTAGSHDETHNGQDDVFVAALASDLSSLTWSTFVGGSGNDSWPTLLIDGDECPLLGYTTESVDLPMGCEAPFDGSHNGNEDPAIGRLTPDGGHLLWSTYFGGTGGEHFQAHSLALDSDGRTMVCAGWTGSDDAPVTPGAYDEIFNGVEDALVYRMVLPPLCGVSSPESFAALGGSLLHRARPNPFTESTEIRFDLPGTAPVSVSVHDAAGRLVRRLTDGPRDVGPHRLVWDGLDAEGSRVAAGVYFYRLQAGKKEEARSVIRLR